MRGTFIGVFLVVLVLLVACLACPTVIVTAAVIRVPSQYPTIQAGVDAASDWDTVILANGTYVGEGNHDIDFLGKKISVESENGANNCYIDCQNAARGVVFQRAEDENSRLQGITIIRGRHGAGGGIYISESSPTITNCRVTECLSQNFGAAIYCTGYYSYPFIVNCMFDGNTAGNGGAVFCYEATPVFISCSFLGNTANDSEGGGGAVFSTEYAAPVFNNCSFGANIAHNGGAIYSSSGLGIAGAGASFPDEEFIRNVYPQNTHFQGEVHRAVFPRDKSYPCMYQSTIAWNLASERGGGIYCTGQSVLIIGQGSIMSGNFAIIAGSAGYIGSNVGFGIGNSCVNGGESTFFAEPGASYNYDAGSIINADPLLISGPRGNYYLSQIAAGQAVDSLCLNASAQDVGAVNYNYPGGVIHLAELTTRIDGVNDGFRADYGFHYRGDSMPTPTMTPTLTPTRTPTTTMTPVPLPIPATSPIGIAIMVLMISAIFFLGRNEISKVVRVKVRALKKKTREM